ncbi:hypothetical protein [Crocosphaera sp. XPORK-15E]|uniref:hypothetical protein n=1 Tax=Crocosphaera sp. XPORK-15E TaxID=3110247 RepID=UPI002B1FFCF3|nr:hypothetical protein [Crocosphaera sp. XPORK-15E]MEA5534379.1 hypothetical protein [Crocosphaera sp. XPORK-15E]
MRTTIAFCASLVSSSFILATPVMAQEFSRNSPYHINNCDYSNYLITNNGQCVDLSGDGSSRYNFYESKFLTALQKAGVSISYESCQPGLLGHYQPAPNRMTICQNNREDFTLYIETLAHESWHVVQDCAAGFDNGDVIPIMKTDSSTYRSILVSLGSADWESLNLYDPQDLPYEMEAFMMEKHPDQVLKALNACASRR